MIIERNKHGEMVVINVMGTITLGESSKKFSDYLEKILQERPKGVIINMDKIDYVDSTGIGELVGYLSRYRDEKIPLALVNPRERILKLLTITGLEKVFPIFEEMKDALKWCERGDSNPHSLSATRS